MVGVSSIFCFITMNVGGLSLFAQLFLVPKATDAQALDPIKNLCARFDHQSTVLNNTLYIYGGFETFAPTQHGGTTSGPITLGYNDYLIELKLDRSWDWNYDIPNIISNVTANPKTGFKPVQAVRGALYHGPPGDASIYLYGGSTPNLNTSFPGWRPPTSATYSLWSYDTAIKAWNQYNVTDIAPYRPSSGASAEAADQSLAFWFNGKLDGGSSGSTQGLGPANTVSLNGLVVINMTDHSARNLSTSIVTGGQPRTGGRMQYLPGIGDHGILVLIGGSTFRSGHNGSSGTEELIAMNGIDIFDISSVYDASTADGIWYRENATGPGDEGVPTPRVDFCLVAASASDSSSHNIYMYGGRDASNNYFDEVWVLSIPAFIWTRVFAGENPRYSHTCHLVGNRTMLTVGGVGDVAQTQGSRFGMMSQCDWEEKGVSILDMSNISWSSVYDAHAPPYKVPDQVATVIGGNAEGNSPAKSPAAGYTDDGLARLFGIEKVGAFYCEDNSAPAGFPTHKIVIIVCSVVGFAILASGIAVTVHYIRKKPASNEQEPVEKDVFPDRGDPPQGLYVELPVSQPTP